MALSTGSALVTTLASFVKEMLGSDVNHRTDAGRNKHSSSLWREIRRHRTQWPGLTDIFQSLDRVRCSSNGLHDAHTAPFPGVQIPVSGVGLVNDGIVQIPASCAAPLCQSRLSDAGLVIAVFKSLDRVGNHGFYNNQCSYKIISIPVSEGCK